MLLLEVSPYHIFFYLLCKPHVPGQRNLIQGEQKKREDKNKQKIRKKKLLASGIPLVFCMFFKVSLSMFAYTCPFNVCWQTTSRSCRSFSAAWYVHVSWFSFTYYHHVLTFYACHCFSCVFVAFACV